ICRDWSGQRSSGGSDRSKRAGAFALLIMCEPAGHSVNGCSASFDVALAQLLADHLVGVLIGGRRSAKDFTDDWPFVPLRPKRTVTSLPWIEISQNLSLPPPTNSNRRAGAVLVVVAMIESPCVEVGTMDWATSVTDSNERRKPRHAAVGQILVAELNQTADRRRIAALGI